MLEELDRVIDRHIKDLSDIFLLVVYFQCFRIVAVSMTDLTWHKDIWQKVHFNLDDPVTRTSFTTATFDVKGETSLLVATDFGFIGLGKQIPNIVKTPV